jgi:L-ascorbate metabolism protein UlaG (beta-lactamase superfamily)
VAGKIRWLGHAFVEFTTSDDRVILFDPCTKDDGNPVLFSHDHADHAASAVAICKKTGAFLGGPVQSVGKFVADGFNKEQVVNFGMGYMVGGGVEFDWVKVVSTPAFHSSETACPLGTIVKASDGTTVYHAGDTCLFGDMELYGKLYPMDVALLPIGGVFTMDSDQASEAVRLINPKIALPIHYASFPIVAQSASDFIKQCGEKAPGVRVIAPAVGESVDI